MQTSFNELCSLIEKDKAVFKIVTKTKNEIFFIEKWIIHHLNILQDTKLIIFDNMSDDDYVKSIYEKYKNNMILVEFDGYMDHLHMAKWSMQIYKALSDSSEFFTIIDSDEYLYLWDGHKIVKDSSIIQFLEENDDCNFFAPLWIENISDNEKLFSFNPLNLSSFHFGKPIINTKIVPMFESAFKKIGVAALHHVRQLPISTYGKTKTKFVILHLKNLNKYQRIKSNMQKLVALDVIKHDNDFSALLKIDLETINASGSRSARIVNINRYVRETRNLVEKILHTDEQSGNLPRSNTIELDEDGALKFAPESSEDDFKKLMDSDYFDLINFDPGKTDINRYTTIQSLDYFL